MSALKRVLYILLVASTIGLLVVAVYTDRISRRVFSYEDESVEGGLEFIDDDPLEGEIRIASFPEMYEGISFYVWFNITMDIVSNTPMNLMIDRIEFFFTPIDYLNRTEPIFPLEVGGMRIDLIVENASHLSIEGRGTIEPVIIDGDVFLGLGIEYDLRNHSSSEPNYWSGRDGDLFMLQVFVYPSYLRVEGWFAAFISTLVMWLFLAIYEFRKKTRYI